MSTTPNVPYRLEFSVEVPGTPEQVWQAIATAKGMSAWFLPTEMEEREGGSLHFTMGPEMGSDGQVTGWDPPRRIVYEEDWAALMGKDPDALSPLTSEFLVEAQSGGTCVVRVTSSGFGTGADWESEFWDDMGPTGCRSSTTCASTCRTSPASGRSLVDTGSEVKGTPADVLATMREQLGASAAGDLIELHGATGQVERLTDRGCSSASPTARSASNRCTCSPRARAPPTPECAGTCSATAPPPAPRSVSGCGHSGSIGSRQSSTELSAMLPVSAVRMPHETRCRRATTTVTLIRSPLCLEDPP